jgi:two-component SAPR family response regulator
MRVVLTLTTEEKEECLQKKYELPIKKIAPKSTEFFSLLIEEKEIKKTATCDTFFHRKKRKPSPNYSQKAIANLPLI